MPPDRTLVLFSSHYWSCEPQMPAYYSRITLLLQSVHNTSCLINLLINQIDLMNCVVVLVWNAVFWTVYPSTQSCYFPAKDFTTCMLINLSFLNSQFSRLWGCYPLGYTYSFNDSIRVANSFWHQSTQQLSLLPVKKMRSTPSHNTITSARCYTILCYAA